LILKGAKHRERHRPVLAFCVLRGIPRCALRDLSCDRIDVSGSLEEIRERAELAANDPASAGILYATQESWDKHAAFLREDVPALLAIADAAEAMMAVTIDWTGKPYYENLRAALAGLGGEDT
jgi:hypothetical protein